MQDARGNAEMLAEKPMRRPVNAVMDVISNGDRSEYDKNAEKIQARWRQKMAQRHVGMIRMVFSEVRTKAEERGLMADDGEVVDERGWKANLREVCGGVMDAVKKCNGVRLGIEQMQSDARHTARLRRIRQRLKFQYMMTKKEETKVHIEGMNEDSWLELYAIAQEASPDDIEGALDDEKIRKADQAARRIQQVWNLRCLDKATTKESTAEDQPRQIKNLKERAERLGRLRAADRTGKTAAERAMAAAAAHVERVKAGIAKETQLKSPKPLPGSKLQPGLPQGRKDAQATVDSQDPKKHDADEQASETVLVQQSPLSVEDVVLSPVDSTEVSDVLQKPAQPLAPMHHVQSGPGPQRGHMSRTPRLAPLGMNDDGKELRIGGSSGSTASAAPLRADHHSSHKVPPIHAQGRHQHVALDALPNPSAASSMSAARSMPGPVSARQNASGHMRSDLKSGLSVGGDSARLPEHHQGQPPAPTSVHAPRAPAAPPPANAGSVARARLSAAPPGQTPTPAGPQLSVQNGHGDRPHKLPANVQRKPQAMRAGAARVASGPAANGPARLNEVGGIGPGPMAITGESRKAGALPPLPALGPALV